ncbi:polysaccharide deacetylase family protein [Limibacter armeniacum]|uniref:polysaccharide deacetylase family protein n=1 Tax=Limibacter armeniacum TaxID=466084 RepID=UPI002FE6A276
MIYQKTGWFVHNVLYPSLTWKRETEEKVIYLTFDDGPIPDVTEWVLEQLEQYQAKATFFCVGDNVRKHPEVFKKLIANGHRVGNHTYNHLKGWVTDNQKYFENIASCRDIISQYTSDTSHLSLFRPPYGQISTKQIKELNEQFDELVMWHVLTCDYDQSMNEEVCLKKSLNLTEAGSIVVFHDSLKAEKNLRYVLPRYLKHFTALGYTFKHL